MTLIWNVKYQSKVLFMKIGTKSSKIWCLLSNIFAIFINLSIFVREYRTRRSGIPHLNERYVTKQQTSHNSMQKTRPRYLNLERFYCGSVLTRQKKQKHSVDPYFVIFLLSFSKQNIYKYNWLLYIQAVRLDIPVGDSLKAEDVNSKLLPYAAESDKK